jgi:hypothetical protein
MWGDAAIPVACPTIGFVDAGLRLTAATIGMAQPKTITPAWIQAFRSWRACSFSDKVRPVLTLPTKKLSSSRCLLPTER